MNRIKPTDDERELVETFMGIPLNDSPLFWKWNDVMPVVEKIEETFDGSIMVFIKDKRCHIEMGTQYGITDKGKDIDVPDCYSGFCETKIEAVCKSVILYIQWYTTQSPNR